MPTPILRNNVGSVFTVTATVSCANNAYSNAADKLTIDNSSAGALLVDFDLTGTFSAAPVVGALQVFAVDYSLDGSVAGPTPSSAMRPRLVGPFSPQPQTGNASTSWRMRLSAVALSAKTDFYIYNNGTAVALNSGWVLKAQCWSPGA